MAPTMRSLTGRPAARRPLAARRATTRAPRGPGAHAEEVLHLQRTVGNRAVAQLLHVQREPVRSAEDRASVRQYFEDVFKLGRRKVAAHDYAGAETVFRMAYDHEGFETHDWGGVVLNIGLCRHWRGDFAGAISFYEEAMDGLSDTERHIVVESVRLARLGQPPEQGGAERSAEEVAADRQYFEDVFKLGRRKVQARDWAGAEKVFRMAYEHEGFETHDWGGVVLNIGLCRHWQRDFSGAMVFYDEAMDGLSDTERHIVVESVRLARLGKLPDAMEADKRSPEDAAADEQFFDDVFKLARLKMKAGDYAGAERVLHMAYDHPGFMTSASPGLVLNLGLCRHWQGDFAGAVSLYQEAIEAVPDERRHKAVEYIRLARLGRLPNVRA